MHIFDPALLMSLGHRETYNTIILLLLLIERTVYGHVNPAPCRSATQAPMHWTEHADGNCVGVQGTAQSEIPERRG